MTFIRGCGADESPHTELEALEEFDDKEPDYRKGNIYRSIFYIHLYKKFIILLFAFKFFLGNLFFTNFTNCKILNLSIVIFGIRKILETFLQ